MRTVRAARRAFRSAATAAAVLFCASGAAWGAGGAGKVYYGDIGQAIATLLIFGLLLLILGRYAWKPIVAQLRQREEDVAKTIERAQDQQREAGELLEHYRARLDQAETEAKEVVASSRREAAEAREELLASARDQARKSVQAAKEEIHRARDEVVRELRETTAELAADIAAEVLGKALRPEDHRRLVDQSLEEIRTRAGEES